MAGICKAKGRHKVWRDGRYCMEKWKCGRKTSSRGYCHTHYSAILKGAKSPCTPQGRAEGIRGWTRCSPSSKRRTSERRIFQGTGRKGRKPPESALPGRAGPCPPPSISRGKARAGPRRTSGGKKPRRRPEGSKGRRSSGGFPRPRFLP